MGDGVIGGADDGHALRFEFVVDLNEVFMCIANFKTDMIQTWFRMMTIAWDAADFNEEEFVVCSTAAKNRGSTKTLQLAKPKRVAIKIRGSFQIADKQDDVTKFVDMHS